MGDPQSSPWVSIPSHGHPMTMTWMSWGYPHDFGPILICFFFIPTKPCFLEGALKGWGMGLAPHVNGLVCWGKSTPETIDFPIFSMGLSCKCSLKPIHWTWCAELTEIKCIGANETCGIGDGMKRCPSGAAVTQDTSCVNMLLDRPWSHQYIDWRWVTVKGNSMLRKTEFFSGLADVI